MVLVKCDMCDEFTDLNEFPEGQIFICLICAHCLSSIKKQEIQRGFEFKGDLRLKLFDNLRKVYGTPENRKRLQEKYND